MLHIRLASIPKKDKHTIDSVVFDARTMIATLENPNLKVRRSHRPNDTVDVYLVDVAAISKSGRANQCS